MDEMNMLKEMRSHRPPMSGRAEAAARARLFNEKAAPARRTNRFRRPVLGLAVATAAATAAVLGVNAAGEGPLQSYSNAAMAIEKDGGRWSVEIKDAYAAPEELAEGFAKVGLKVNLTLAPVSPERERKVLSISRTFGGVKTGTEFEIRDCPDGVRECTLALTIESPKNIEWEVALGRKALAGEPYFDTGFQDAAPREPVQGLQLMGGTVGEAVKALRTKSFEPLFALRGYSPDGPGWPFLVDPSWRPADSRRVLSAHAHDLKTIMLVLEPRAGDPKRLKNPPQGLLKQGIGG